MKRIGIALVASLLCSGICASPASAQTPDFLTRVKQLEDIAAKRQADLAALQADVASIKADVAVVKTQLATLTGVSISTVSTTPTVTYTTYPAYQVYSGYGGGYTLSDGSTVYLSAGACSNGSCGVAGVGLFGRGFRRLFR
jgi:hypothetical protein